MAKMTVEMTTEEVKQAVTEWAEKHHGLRVKRVDYGAPMEWRGCGPHESQAPAPYVKFEAG